MTQLTRHAWTLPAIVLLAVLVLAGSCGRGCGAAGPGSGMREAGAGEAGGGVPAVGAAFLVDLVPSPTEKGVCDVHVRGEKLGSLDRLGRKATIAALRARADSAFADVLARQSPDWRVHVKASPLLDPLDVSEVMGTLSAAGFRDISFEGYPLSRRHDRWR